MRLLFIPVSSDRGSGEYARLLALATAATSRWPQARPHFVLSRAAPHAARCPFPATVLESSATFHTKEVVQLMRELRPHVVIFDNAGRTAQLQAARACGARIVYVSARARQRRKAFRVRWMRLLDEHWIAYPEVVAGALTPFERLKLRWLGRPVVRFLGALVPRPEAAATQTLLGSLRLEAGRYVLVVPGSGAGHRSYDGAERVFAEAAARLAARGYPTVLVGTSPPVAPPAVPAGGALLRATPALPMHELMALVQSAQLVVCNGAGTLLQVLASGKPCVAAPMAPDQERRLERFREAGLPAGAPLDAGEIEHAALALLTDAERRADLLVRSARLGIRNEIDALLDAIGRLA